MPETLTVLSNHASSQDVSFLWSGVVVAVAESCEASRDNVSVLNSNMKCISGAMVAAWSIELEMIKHFGILNLILTGCLAPIGPLAATAKLVLRLIWGSEQFYDDQE